MKLTPAILSSWNPDKPLSELISAKCNNKQITHIDDISACVQLHKLDLSNNEIKKTGSLSGLRYCSELTWLNLQNNQLDVCPPFTYQEKDGLGKMDKLLERITPYLYKLKELKALILGHNKITKIENLEALTNLNTLVLSYNKIEEVNNLTCLKSLTKLSIAHNRIRVFPDLRMNTELKELRLNNNRLLGVPEYVKFLPKLEILDLGNNFLKEFSDIENLKTLLHLNNLNLKGNPVTKLENYKEKVLDLIPSLKVLDGERFDKKFLERREKRKVFLEHKRKKEIAKKLGLGKKKSKKNKKKEEDQEDNNDHDNNNKDDTKKDKKSTKKIEKSNEEKKGEETINNDGNDNDVEIIEKPKKSNINKKKVSKETENGNDSDVQIIEKPKKTNKINKKNALTEDANDESKKPRSLKINKNSKLIKKEEPHLNNGKYRKTGRSHGYFDYVNEMERVSKEQEESIGNMKRKVDIKEDDFFVEKKTKTKTKSKKLAKKEDGTGKKKRKSAEIEEEKTSRASEAEKVVKAPKLESKPETNSKIEDELEMKNRSGVVEVISDVNAGKGKSGKGKKGKANNNAGGKVLVTQFNPGLWSAKKSDKDNIVKADTTKESENTKTEAKQSIWGSNVISGWD